MAGFEASLDFNFASGPILEFGFLPGWIEGIIAALFVGVIGYFILKKIKEPLEQLVEELNLPKDTGSSFIRFFTTIMTIYVVGVSLKQLPNFTNPELIPASAIGNIITTLVSFSFQLLVPIALIFLGLYISSNNSKRQTRSQT